MRLLLALTLSLAACTTQVDLPLVQTSSEADPKGNIVAIVAEGYSVPCLTIRAGETVEWRNTTPSLPANVTSLSEPAELFSPNLVTPYNIRTLDGETFSWWRHTFERPGVFEVFDTNRGDPGRKVVDPYYGTVTFVGTGGNVQTGIVCVESAGGDECDGVCCVKTVGDCPNSQCCDLLNKRCVLASPKGDLRLCEGEKPAIREFECFTDGECPETGDCLATTHMCRCGANAHCPAARPLCDLDNGKCKEN